MNTTQIISCFAGIVLIIGVIYMCVHYYKDDWHHRPENRKVSRTFAVSTALTVSLFGGLLILVGLSG